MQHTPAITKKAGRTKGAFGGATPEGSVRWPSARVTRAVIGLALWGLCGVFSAARAQDWVYSVRPGDNLWNLTERHLKSLIYVGRLQTLNRISNPYLVPPGTRLRIPLDWARRRPGAARVVATGGECTLTRAGSNSPAVLAAGMDVGVGDSVTCAANSYTTLEFEDGSRLRVQPGSQIRLDAAWVYGDSGFFESDIALQRGRTENEVPAKERGATRLRIRTPASITSVRGTRFRVATDSDDSSSRSEVERGKVGVSARNREVPVGAGFGTLTRAGAAPSPPVPMLPPPDLSSLPAVMERVPLRFVLTPLAGASGYRGGIATDAGFNIPIAEFTAATPTLPGPDVPDGEYWLRVRGSDAQGIEGHDAIRRFTLNARPEPPFVLEPQPGGSTDVTPTFAWSAHPDADRYEIEVATDADFGKPLLAERGVRDTRFRAASAFAPGRYYWRIATASATDGRGPMSDAMPFRVPYPGPTASAPSVSRGKLAIQWARAAPDQTFQFQLANDEGFTKLRVDEHLNEPRIELKRPPGGRYYLRIRTIEADGFAGPFGRPQRIDIPYSRWWLLTLAPLVLLL